jgi:predicted RND superfamily exporter protein
VLPLILGTGIDFAIHQVTEFAHRKREGLSDQEALRKSGGYAGFAMFIAAVTSISGLLVMTVSPSLLMAQLGLLAAIAIAAVYLLTITFMPALLTLAESSDDMGRKFEPSGIVTTLARGFSQHRLLVGAMLVLLTAGALVGTQHLTVEEFGEPAQNFPEDDPLRKEHEEGIRGFYDLEDGDGEELKTNVIVFQGDNTDLQAHRYIEEAQEEMSGKENLRMSTSRNLPFLMRTWLTVKDGGPGAAEQIGRDTLRTCTLPNEQDLPCEGTQRAENYPQTREEIQSEMDQMFESPLDTFASLFVSEPQYNISTMTLATTTGDFEDAEAAWNDVWTSLDAVEDRKPEDLEPAFVGNTALNYLFITEELPWLSYLGIVSGLVLAFLTVAFTKDLRATTAVMTVMTLTGLWWLGVLPAFDIGLAITLMLPAVFITSIGADYAIHMTWNLIKNPDRDEVYGVVGKAVLFSAITDAGAFAIFTQTQNVAASEAMVATVLAIAVMFVVTLMVMPLFYPNRPTEADEPETTEAAVETPGGTQVVEAT